jgi:gluconolactonase
MQRHRKNSAAENLTARIPPEIPIESFEIFASGIDHAECIAFDRDGNLWAVARQDRFIASRRMATVSCANLGSYSAGIAVFSPLEEICSFAIPTWRRACAQGRKFSVFPSHCGEHKLICPNYGLFDSAGNYYVTDSGLWKERYGLLLRYTPDGRGEILAGPFGYTNGLALGADEKNSIHGESKTDSVHRFEICATARLARRNSTRAIAVGFRTA